MKDLRLVAADRNRAARNAPPEPGAEKKDLVLLVADRNQEAAVKALLGRHRSLGIRPVAYDLHVHPRRDPGCFREAHEFLRPLRDGYDHALVLFDAAWEGAPLQVPTGLEQTGRTTATEGTDEEPPRDPTGLEEAVRGRFREVGIEKWADVVVIVPELEVWVWSDSPHVDQALGWAGRAPGLRRWLAEQNLWPEGMRKPPDPMQALERALWQTRVPRESRVYAKLARTVSVKRCEDASFARLRRLLVSWFPEGRS